MNEIEQFWQAVSLAMYSASVCGGINIDSVVGESLNEDYVVNISGSVKNQDQEKTEENLIDPQFDSFTGTIKNEDGKVTLTMQAGDTIVYNDEVNTVEYDDPDETGECLTHQLDDCLF